MAAPDLERLPRYDCHTMLVCDPSNEATRINAMVGAAHAARIGP